MRKDGNRLDRMIARLATQRAVLLHAIDQIANIEGQVLEVGLGKGRTWSFLRERLPDRKIIAFDRSVHAPPGATPAPDDLVLGAFEDTLAVHAPAAAAMIHADFGSEDPDVDRALAGVLSRLLPPLLVPGGVIAADRELASGQLTALPLPPSGFAYFLYRRTGP